ncbi:unnamed protein product [Leptidea sinapis]|uniref:Serine protease K12H4.7 n=1 Tax=Leptidea sinapis TaxID=189913 RepID=A0A5E4QWL0_9NEOP|nr:unnamed protein product [Leptidea sinapis]
MTHKYNSLNKKRYFVNDSFFDSNEAGPIFLMVGGESEANPQWMIRGTWINYAQKFKALCLMLEHRYYGKSHPTPSCSQPFSTMTTDDVKVFYNSVAQNFAQIVQYNEVNRLNLQPEFQNVTINTVCDMFTKAGDEPYEALVKLNDLIIRMGNADCIDYKYDTLISDLRNTTITVDLGRQWTYQTCTEFGFYQTSSDVVSLFGDYFPIDLFVKQCQDIFGTILNETLMRSRIDWTNTNYGGLNIEARRIVFVHGSIDPWHVLGITESRLPEMPTIFMNGTAHCANMYEKRDENSKELTEARIQIETYLDNWLNK